MALCPDSYDFKQVIRLAPPGLHIPFGIFAVAHVCCSDTSLMWAPLSQRHPDCKAKLEKRPAVGRCRRSALLPGRDKKPMAMHACAPESVLGFWQPAAEEPPGTLAGGQPGRPSRRLALTGPPAAHSAHCLNSLARHASSAALGTGSHAWRENCPGSQLAKINASDCRRY